METPITTVGELVPLHQVLERVQDQWELKHSHSVYCYDHQQRMVLAGPINQPYWLCGECLHG